MVIEHGKRVALFVSELDSSKTFIFIDGDGVEMIMHNYDLIKSYGNRVIEFCNGDEVYIYDSIFS